MKKYQTTLTGDDLGFFYAILYQYEKEGGKQNGYNFNKIPPSIKSSIKRICNKKYIQFPLNDNEIIIKGKFESKLFIKQIRNAFAHACIEVDSNENYIINKSLKQKCSISGKINREIFKKFVNAILNTRK